MFGSMGMFGAFGCDPEEVAKKNEEMKREAEARRKFEENLDKPITITKRQFMELSATVVAQGGFMDKAVEHDPKMGFVLIQYRPEHGSAAFHRRFLADVPRFRFNRLRYGPETLRDTQLGLVYGFRRTGNPLQYRHYLATRSWSVIPCLYDRVHFADHRHLPGYAFLRTEELAQTEQRIQRINRMLFSAVSNP